MEKANLKKIMIIILGIIMQKKFLKEKKNNRNLVFMIIFYNQKISIQLHVRRENYNSKLNILNRPSILQKEKNENLRYI